jgi:hypothetical protein
MVFTDEDLLCEIVRLAKALGREPTEADMDAYGAFDAELYEQRWDSFPAAREEAYRVFETPVVVKIYREWLLELSKQGFESCSE